MKTWLQICRFHLLQRMNYFVLPLVLLGFGFVVDVVVLKLTPAGHSPNRWVGGLGAIYVLVFVLGVQSVARSLPYALSLGITRRAYYVGTTLLAAVFGAGYGLLIAIGQVLERATDGWGFKMAFFRVPYILDGAWYLTWLTAGVVCALLFVLGTWFGLAFRRWGLVGAIGLAAALISVLVLGAAVATWTSAWASLGHFFTTLSAAGLTELLLVLAVALGSGALVTIRRITV
jgi:hypothetical protein